MLKNFALALALLAAAAAAAAQPLTPFQASYEASYRGLKAAAQRGLERLDGDQYRYESSVRLKLLGQTVTRINEHSVFYWDHEQLLPTAYEFVQTGFGSRSRSVSFDWDKHAALTQVNDRTTSLPLELEEPVFDELSAYVELKRQLETGAREITLNLVDKDRFEEDRYRVLGEERVKTAMGVFSAIKLEKVRGPGSDRVTQLWLAREWDYMLLKLYQREPGDDELTLTIAQGSLGGEALTPLNL